MRSDDRGDEPALFNVRARTAVRFGRVECAVRGLCSVAAAVVDGRSAGGAFELLAAAVGWRAGANEFAAAACATEGAGVRSSAALPEFDCGADRSAARVEPARRHVVVHDDAIR